MLNSSNYYASVNIYTNSLHINCFGNPVYVDNIPNENIHNVKNNPDKLVIALFNKDYPQGVNVLVNENVMEHVLNDKNGSIRFDVMDIRFEHENDMFNIKVKEGSNYVNKQMSAKDLADGHNTVIAERNAKKREAVKSAEVEVATSVETDKHFGE